METKFITSNRGQQLLVLEKFKFRKGRILKSGELYWRCAYSKCSASVYTIGPDHLIIRSKLEHNHDADVVKLNRQEVSSSCKRKAVEDLSEPPAKLIRRELQVNLPATITTIDINYIRKNIYNARRNQFRSALPRTTEDAHLVLSTMNVTTNRVDDESQNVGALIIEGKTKRVFDLPSMPGHCLVLSKDRITAGDGVKAHDLAGKAAISNRTNAKVFEILSTAGLRTAFVRTSNPTSFIARKCQMIPIEWVTRRLATGSFLKRNPGVSEGHRFVPVKLETFYKDDANHDPQWSREQVICAEFIFNGTIIGPAEVDIIERTTVLVFEILEKAWSTKNCALIDMKVEFGVDENGDILLADIIDSDSWRLWPSGDKRLMVDKQVYRNLGLVVSEADLDQVRRNFEWVAQQLDTLLPATASDHLIAILMGSPADKGHCEKIRLHCQAYGLNVEIRVSSAHKGTEDTLRILKEYEAMTVKVILIAVAGRSNGLGPVISGNSALPVINCPPVTSDNMERDIWSSLAVPSGLGCSTVLYPESAAIHAATMLGLSNYIIWARIRVKKLNMVVGLKMADKNISEED